MKHWNQTAALLLAAMLTLSALTGCGGKEKDFTKEEELPYGATMHSNKTAYAVPITYDRRYFDEEAVQCVADFCGAIQNGDGALYEKTVHPLYASYQLEEVYAYESYDEIAAALHDSLASKTADDFTFTMVLISAFSSNAAGSNLSECLDLLEKLYEGDGKFEDTLENAWDLSVEWDFAYDSGVQHSVIEEQHIMLLQTADGYFVVM